MAHDTDKYDREFYEKLVAVDPSALSRTLSEHKVGAWILDLITNELHISQGLLDLIGYQETPGRDRFEILLSLYSQSQIDEIRKATANHIENGEPYYMAGHLRHGSGRHIRVLTRGRAVYDSDGQPTHMIGVLSIQDDLELAKSNLDQIERLNQIGTFRYDYASSEMTLSDGACRLLGYDPKDSPIGKDEVATFYHEEDKAVWQQSISKAEAGDGSFEFDARLIAKDGSEHFVRAAGQVEFGRDGEPVSRVGILQDLTESRLREKELSEAKGLLDRAEEMAHLGHWRYDLVSEELFWSRGVYLIHGHEPGSFQPTRDFARSRYVNEDLPVVEQHINRSLATGHPFEYQVRILNKEEAVRHIKVQGEVETNTSGNAIAYFGIAQDITAEVQRELQTRQTQKMEAIGNLTGGLAHDFNNVLGVILGNLEIVLDDLQDEQARSLVRSSIDATLRGGDLTKNMLSFARQAPLEAKVLDLNEVTQQSLRWIVRTLPATIALHPRLDEEVWKVETDRGSTENAILNLVINARDAMPDGGDLTIETRNLEVQAGDQFYPPVEPGLYVMLAISDTGSGISKTDLERIFEPFFTTKDPGKGTGLGLAMVHGFMRQIGGEIRVYSEVGIGTTFKLLFRAADQKVSGVSNDVADGVTVTSGARILLVEDEREIADLIFRMLTKAGYRTVTAASGDQALKKFEEDSSFDILLTDIVMPGELQGPALSKELRGIKPELAVVFLSGYANEATVHGNGLRPEDIRLMKPVRRAELLVAIEKAFSGASRSKSGD